MEKDGILGLVESFMKEIFGWIKGKGKARSTMLILPGIRDIGGMINERGRACCLIIIRPPELLIDIVFIFHIYQT
jgi:hypothetical protein